MSNEQQDEMMEQAMRRWADGPALRDQFAMAALTGLSSREGYEAETVSQDAYRYADAMLKARETSRSVASCAKEVPPVDGPAPTEKGRA